MPFSFLNTVMSWFLKKRIHQIELFMKYPIEVQNETLTSLLNRAKNTEFGKKHDFKSIKNYQTFSNRIPLSDYENFYNFIISNFDSLPPRIQKMMPYMIEQNWLLSYASIDGIGKILDQMNRRTNNQSKMNLAVLELTTYYKEYEEEFTLFFEDLKKYSKNKIIELKRL